MVDPLAEAPGAAESSVLLQAASTTEPVMRSATCLDFFTIQRRCDSRADESREWAMSGSAGNRSSDNNADTHDDRRGENGCSDVLVLADFLFEIESDAGIKKFEAQNRQTNADQTKDQRRDECSAKRGWRPGNKRFLRDGKCGWCSDEQQPTQAESRNRRGNFHGGVSKRRPAKSKAGIGRSQPTLLSRPHDKLHAGCQIPSPLPEGGERVG